MATSNPSSPLDHGHNRPTVAITKASNSSSIPSPARKKKHRGGRKKRNRRQSFAPVPSEDMSHSEATLPSAGPSDARNSFYLHGRNLSNMSLESEVLLDHRDHYHGSKPRRASNLATSFTLPPRTDRERERLKNATVIEDDDDDDGTHSDWGEGAPLLSSSRLNELGDQARSYGSGDTRPRRGSSRSSRRRMHLAPMTPSNRYNVNYPPSIPGTPPLSPVDVRENFGDEMMREGLAHASRSRTNSLHVDADVQQPGFERRHTIALQAEEDVCFPQEGLSELGDDVGDMSQDASRYRRSRRQRNKWPDLSILEEWSRFEKEGRSEERRIKKITEPQLVNGRLRPVHKGWYRPEDDAPYRFTYFNEEFQSTIHSQTISELVQEGNSFRELFVPDPPVLSDSDCDSDEEETAAPPSVQFSSSFKNGNTCSKFPTRQPSVAENRTPSDRGERNSDGTVSPKNRPVAGSRDPSPRRTSGEATPVRPNSAMKSPPLKQAKPVRYGERPVWWLDVLCPTEAEMKALQAAFKIHPLTSEDIMLQEPREKVELFQHYYFVNYRSFDQDEKSETHLDPVNIYVVVFREGVISFHFEQTPHPANVRRRIRQLRDYMVLSADWISYAIIDDITDAFVPLIQIIEEDVDDIDDEIIKLHWNAALGARIGSNHGKDSKNDEKNDRQSMHGGDSESDGGDTLQRIVTCRKKVLGLLRLLGNKADVIKGFAKRCNEHWEVAPRSEIGLYLGDIQDHIVTMTGNLSHYEQILTQANGNYLAQINIRMNKRAEETADTLGKLTVLGTIVLPMNIITGLWGMNVWVPGQEYEGDLSWFFCITAGLCFFGVACYVIAKRVYNIV